MTFFRHWFHRKQHRHSNLENSEWVLVHFLDADPVPYIIDTDIVSADGGHESNGHGSPDEFIEVDEEIFISNVFKHQDSKVNPTSSPDNDISGFEVELDSTRDHILDYVNQNNDNPPSSSPPPPPLVYKAPVLSITSKPRMKGALTTPPSLYKTPAPSPPAPPPPGMHESPPPLPSSSGSCMQGGGATPPKIPHPPPSLLSRAPPPSLPSMHVAPPPPEALPFAPAPPPPPSPPPFAPPPLLRGAPGPPPPHGQLGGGPCRRCERGGPIMKRSNLKPLHWIKLNRVVKGTLWEELQKQSPPEIEELFANAPPKKAAPTASSSKPEKVRLIDQRRANNTEIMLTKVKMPYSELVDAILAMDDTLLVVDQVENILKFFPTKEEMEKLKNYSGDLEKLDKCEQYFLELMRVPRMETKLNAFLFKIQFNSQIEDLKKSLNIVNSACNEVRESIKLKEIMKTILHLGNTLNQGTARGAVVGFKLHSPLKLAYTRASTSRMTLMHYLCKLIATKSPTLLDFQEDLVNLEAVTKIQLKALAEEMQSLISGLKKMKQELDASANDGPISSGFHSTLKGFIGHAEDEVASLSNFYDVVKLE